MTETNGAIEITIQIPDALLNTDASINRVYKIIRIHDGAAEVLDGTFEKTLNIKKHHNNCLK